MLVSVTRLWNEDDIIEAFVRHHARQVDHFVFLDNVSTDRTLDILAALAAEGVRITVFEARSVSFDEAQTNTWLYDHAAGALGADWVLFLDADEFVDPTPLPDAARAAPRWLAATLAALPNDCVAADLQMFSYIDSDEDDAAEPCVPRRLRWRRRPADLSKVFVRGRLVGPVTVEPGNHAANLRGERLPMTRIAPMLAHYGRRSGWHDLSKSATGWLKVLAAERTQERQARNGHYRAPFEHLRDHAGWIVHEPSYRHLPVDRATMTEQPLPYDGGSLCHTRIEDPAMRALMLAVRYTEALARQHGRLIDESTEARALVGLWNAERRLLMRPG